MKSRTENGEDRGKQALEQRIPPLTVYGFRGDSVNRWGSLLAAAVIPFACACSVISYTGSGGERFSRTSIGSATSLSSLVVETGTNGMRRVELHGYQTETSQVLGVVTEAAVRGALQSR